jgi:hypothetical protein
MMLVLVAVILALHLIGDFFYRVDFQLHIYRTTLGYLLHALEWAFLICIPLVVYKRFTVQKFLFLFLTHYFIDTNKMFLFAIGRWEGYIIDQILHLGSIFFVFYLRRDLIVFNRKKAHP